MTRIRTYKATVRRWSFLGAKLNELKQPAFKSARLLLTQHISRVKEAKLRQAILTAERRKATRELQQSLAEASEIVSRIYGLMRAVLGPRNEKLLRLGLNLQRRPSSKQAPSAEGGRAAPPATTPTA